MKRFLFSAAILCAVLGFTSCGDSKNGGDLTVDAKVANGKLVSSQIDEVRAMGYIYSEYSSNDIIIATAPFKNGGFKIKLPKKIDERLLESMYEDFEDELPEGIIVSNKNVKATYVEEFLAFKNNKEVGYFEYYYESPQIEGGVMYVFVDGDCKISGSFSEKEEWDGTIYKEEYICDLNLKKGWNAVYGSYTSTRVGNIYTYKEEATTKKPNIDYTWYFYEWHNYWYEDNYDSPKQDVKKRPKAVSKLFRKK